MRAAVLVLVAVAAATIATAQPVALPDLSDTEVTLSWQDFKRLVEAGRPVPTPRAAPPRDAVLRSAEYRGRLADGVLLLDAVLQLEVLADAWVQVPLWSSGSVVAFEGAGAVLTRADGGAEVLARGPRRFEIRATLAFAAPLRPGENRLELALPDAPLNLLDVSAGPGLDGVEIETALTYRAEPRRSYAALVGGRATVVYTVPYREVETGGGQEVALEPRVLLTATEFLSLGDGVVAGTLVLDYQVRVAEVGDFELILPPGIEVFDATAPGLESWKVLERDGGRVLRLRLGSPASGAVRAVVTFDGAYDRDTGRLSVPRFEPLGVERESGFIAVAADGAEVEVELAGNLLPADVSEIREDVRAWGGSLVEALKYSGPPAQTTVTVTEHEDAAVLTAIVERLNASTVLLDDGTEATWLDLAVKNNRRQFLRLALPKGEVEVWSLLVDGEPTRPKRDGDQVLVPLPTGSGERQSQIALVLLRRGREVPSLGRVRPSLPGLDVPVSEAMWTLYLPPGRRYALGRNAFRLLRSTAPFDADGSGHGLSGFARGVAMAPMEEMQSYLSDETVAKQKVQTEVLQQQLARQGASRRGSLPVRIGLPGGVSSMPRLEVARILVVETEPIALPVRVYPEWLRSLLSWLRGLLALAVGVASGALLLRRPLRRHARWVGLGAVVSLLPFGGLGLGAVIGYMILGGIGSACVLAIRHWRSRRRSATADLPLTPPPQPPVQDV